MKKFQHFAIVGREDIEGAVNRMAGDLLILRQNAPIAYQRMEANARLIMSAATVAAEVAAHQGGLVILEEGLNEWQRREVEAQIRELRRQPGGAFRTKG